MQSVQHALFPGLDNSRIQKAKRTSKDDTFSNYCYPTFDTLLSSDGFSKPINKPYNRPSPYDIQDSIFDFEIMPRVSTAIPKSQSRSPPPTHVINCLPKSFVPSTGISIDNFMPDQKTFFTDPLTVEAIKNLGMNQSDLFYPENPTREEIDNAHKLADSVKKERERLFLKMNGDDRRSEYPRRTDIDIKFGSTITMQAVHKRSLSYSQAPLSIRSMKTLSTDSRGKLSTRNSRRRKPGSF